MTTYSHEKQNVFILVLSQLLFMVATITVMTLSGIIGSELTPNPALATLPISLMMLGTLIFTLPASLYMRRVGRKVGFMTGAAIGGIGGGALIIFAIAKSSFLLFCLGNMLIGFYQGFATYYRFAAADVASPKFKNRAISFVMAAGVVAAFLGPWNAKAMTLLIPSIPQAGPYFVVALFALIAIGLLGFLKIPPQQEQAFPDSGRPMQTIVKQPTFMTALTAAVIGYAIMVLVMTATPLALKQRQFEMHDIAFIMQWHVLGMFAPSFFTGSLISRFGFPRVLYAGSLILLLSALVAVSGETLAYFWVSLVLLGVGWNFLFIGGSALVATVHTPAEKGKTQGVNDLIIFTFVALGSLLSGTLLYSLGWQNLNLAMIPFILLVIATTYWWQRKV